MMNESSSPNQELDKQKILNPREISKDRDQNGRANLLSQAKDIKNQRQESNKDISSLSEQKKEKEAQLEKRINNIVFKLKKLAGIDDKRSAILESEIIELKDSLNKLKEKSGKIPNSKELLDAYYEKVAETPLTNEEKREYLKPELLSQLSMEEYIALWKRLNPYFLSHVTRQGFRDHNAMFYHSAGLQEYHNGFTGIIEKGKSLKSKASLQGLDSVDKSSIPSVVESWVLEAESETEAKDRLNNLLNYSLGEAPAYPDKIATHFAAQLVADGYYGGERANEVFFVFPSDMMSSQYDFAFNGWQKDFTKPQSETKWNDVFIWSGSKSGIPIDAGIAFLPKDAQVDPKTGSKYASQEIEDQGEIKKVMVEDEKLMSDFVTWGLSLNEDNNQIVQQVQNYVESPDSLYNPKDSIRRDCISAIKNKLEEIGLPSDVTFLLADKLMSKIIQAGYRLSEKSLSEQDLREVVEESGAKYKRAESPIKAQDYWENFFKENPQLKPKHIVYYNGDPTTAVYDFQQKYGIGSADTSATEGKLLGFDDHHVEDMRNDPRANRGYEELKKALEEIIEERYSKQKVSV